jgi:PAS domain S-box-containing protein
MDKKKIVSQTGVSYSISKNLSPADLLKEGLQAQSIFDYPRAIELYSAALSGEKIPPEMAFEILDQRSECYERMGQFSEELDDLDQMVVKAQVLGDLQKQMDIVYRRLFTAARMGKSTKVNEIAEATRAAGENSEHLSISAAVNLSVGYKYWFQEEKKTAQEYFERALRMYRAVGDRQGEGNTLAALGSVILDSGHQTLAGKYSKDALTIWRSLGNRKKEASSLNAWGLTVSDYALKRDAGEEALEIFKAIGDRWGQCQMYNNLSLLYGHLGLYNTARDYARRAVEMVRPMGARYGLALYLDSLARAEMNLGHFSEAEIIFKEGQEISREIGSRAIEGFDLFGLGRVALMSGRAEEALIAFQAALENFRETNIGSDIPSILAWLGAAYLALDDPQTARRFTADAITELESIGIGGSEYPPQEIWWWHYQALTYDLRTEEISAGKGEGKSEIPDSAWAALQRAREITLEGIATLSDEGLRRNYLNKVINNREIISEWVYQAILREQDIGLGDTPPGNVQAQLQRQLAIGTRMNERREIQALTDFIMDVLIELSGAERALLVLVNESDERQIAASYGFSEDGRNEFLTQASSIFDEVENSSVPVLREDANQKGKLSTPPDPLHTLSILCVPLISRGKPSGIIYADNHVIFGEFTQADVDLLASFANQVSAAIENAQLYQDLEQRVIERTAELSTSNKALEQRNAEFGIINSVQAGLASKLDFQEIIDLVGEKIQEIFAIENMGISILDREKNQIRIPFFVENGKRYPVDPFPYQENSGVTAHVLRTRQPLLVFENLEQVSLDLGSTQSMGDEDSPMAESLISVPIMMGDEAIGTIGLFDHQKNAFNESDLGLLTTLANSMSVALENARLFDRTNNLLEETQRRSAELAIINSVQEALASKLEFQSVIDFVGDKLQDVLDTENIEIRLIDTVSNLVRYPYMYERGKRFEFPPAPISGISKYLAESLKPLVINENLAEKIAEIGSFTLPGTETAKSLLAVPFSIREGSIGVIIVEDYENEHAFSESDLNLLMTLAGSMSVALENARLFDETNRLLGETQQRAAELATVNTVGQALTSELEMDALIELIGEQVRQIFSADITYVALYDRQSNMIEFPYAVGEDLESMPYGEGLTSKILESAEALLINEDVNQRVDEIGATHTGVDVQSYLGVPILVGKQAIGVISVQSMDRIQHFDQDDVRLLSTIAANVGAAIRNAQLYQETEQRADEMAALTEIGREISATLDLENVLERIATRAQEVLNARTATIRLLEEDGSLPTVVALGKYAEKHRGTTIKMGEGITGNVAKTGKAEIINDPYQDERIVHIPGTPDEEEEFEAIIFAPLTIGERVIGVMGLWRDRLVAGPFTQADLNFLNNLARQAANAIENARLFEEVQREKLYSEALLQNSPVAIMTSDLDNRIVSWNPAAENLFGYSAEEAIGLYVYDLISNEKADEEIADNFNSIRGGGRVNTVTKRYRKDGSPVDVELLALPVVMEGKQVGLIAIYHDITELLKARHEAEAANEAKSAFLATMSHEIRTPMNGVIGMTSLLLETELDPEQLDFTETIRNSGEALLTVINDILDFSKIEAGKMELEEQPFDLRDCLESSLDLLKLNASEKGVELAYQMNPDVPAVIVGDITRLRQVLINLLNNGLKFTEQGEVVLSVSTEAVPIQPDGPFTLHFSICDTGIGIPPDRLNRLFQAFSQVDASTSRKYGGTGLGLAISKRLSELMGGEMWVESVEGEGTTFHFTIATPSGPEIKDRDDLKGEHPQLQGKRLLIVDDNLTNRRILTLQTRAWGMHPRDTSDPKEALKWVKRGDPFDLIILDYHMPGMDGIELSGEIRKVTEVPQVLFSSISAREIALEKGQFAAYLMKPLKPSVLLDTLMNLFADQARQIEPESDSQKVKLDDQIAKNLPLRILLVEDNAVNQKLALRLLEQMGYRADLAGNGLEALQAIGRQKYDVVFMDVQMPEMDGLEASRRICARWARGERPYIIAMTANAMQGDRERCLEAGMDDYVSKPIRVNELVAALNKAKPLEILE